MEPGANYNGVDNGTGGGQTLYRFYVRFAKCQNGAKMTLRTFGQCWGYVNRVKLDGRDMCDMKWRGAYISYILYKINVLEGTRRRYWTF
jgi:hypothetical protein